MESIIQKEKEYQLLAQAEKNQITSDINSKIYDLQRQHKYVKKDESFMGLGCGCAVVVTIILAAIFSLGGGAIILVGLIATPIAAMLLRGNAESNAAQHNRDLDQQIDALRQEEARQHKAVDVKYSQMLQRETDRFKASVKASRNKYASHTAAQPIVNWLSAYFEKQIMNADRRPHNKNIEVVFAFRVDANQVATLKKVKVNNTMKYANSELFDFNVNNVKRFHNLNDFEDRVGFSQAIAKLVQFDIMLRYPKDPVCPSHAKPVVQITSDDSLMELHYQVANPNYQHAVTL